MRKIDFAKDQKFYNQQHTPPSEYRVDVLDLYRFNMVERIYQGIKNGPLFYKKTLLNIAGGYGREAYLILLRGAESVALCDYSVQQIGYAKKYLDRFSNKHLLCADGERLPFKDKSFDVCFITEALHHFIHPGGGLEEFIRVTKDVVVIDEPAGGLIRNLLNRIFVVLGVKEEYERGYLEPFRIEKKFLRQFCLKFRLDMIFFPYFIYYFGWYKKTNNQFAKILYKIFLSTLNKLFHFLGNRVIVVLSPTIS